MPDDDFNEFNPDGTPIQPNNTEGVDPGGEVYENGEQTRGTYNYASGTFDPVDNGTAGTEAVETYGSGNVGQNSSDSVIDTYGSDTVDSQIDANTATGALDTYGSDNVEGMDTSASATDAAVDQFGEQGEEQTKASSEYVRDESTVAGQLQKILDSDSPLMQQAAARGRATAKASGWESAGAGAGAVQKELIGAAMGIAKPDATTQASHDAMEHKQDIEQDAAAKGQEYKVRSTEQIAKLEEDMKRYEHDLSTLDKEQQYDVFERMSKFTHDLDTLGKLTDLDIKKNLTGFQHDLNIQLQEAGLDSKERQVAQGAISALTNVMMQNMANINQNTDMPQADKEAAINQQIEQYKQSANLYTSFIGTEITF